MGVANNRSIAWHIAKMLHAEGARLMFTYHAEKFAEKAVPLFNDIGAHFYTPLDVGDDRNFELAFDAIADNCNRELDFLVHSIAGGLHRSDLEGRFVDTSRDGFLRAMDISVYSFIKALSYASPMMRGRGASALTLTYFGSERVIPNYQAMGPVKAALESSVRYLAAELGEDDIRINALSPGPVLTKAASGLSNFRSLLKEFSRISPMNRSLDPLEIGKSALYLVSDLSTGVTGEVIHVDTGFNIMG